MPLKSHNFQMLVKLTMSLNVAVERWINWQNEHSMEYSSHFHAQVHKLCDSHAHYVIVQNWDLSEGKSAV